ncbi:MAG: hypothetical protein H6Q15_1381 [Bacteroidetes bacterium]|nr:hypothetical protein [Bacteroidota bacterium]
MNESLDIQQRFIDTLKKTLPPNLNLATYLINLLSLGKEAIYRRLRNEVKFTLEEIEIIARDLDLSIDDIFINNETDKAIYELIISPEGDSIKRYSIFLENYTNILVRMKASEDSNLTSVFNTLPFFFSFEYNRISKFQLYSFIFHVDKEEKLIPFSEFYIPDRVCELESFFLGQCSKIKNQTYILSRNIFKNLANDIVYLNNIGLITDKEKLILKQEILNSLLRMETLAASGKLSKDSNFNLEIYVSDLDIETTYISLFSTHAEFSYMFLYNMNTMSTKNPRVFKRQEAWIDSLKKLSTLISKTCFRQRKEYFIEQREIINKLLV